MYQINKAENRIIKIQEKTFSELGFRERDHLQEWLANNPEALGEELLIIQKEFDGFNDTNERLDLLAIDKQGNLVIVENKLDDTGRDVTWQVLKYASYCSTLSKENIRQIYQKYLDRQSEGLNAEENLIDFFNANDFTEISLNSGQTQRIIMVAGSFRKEVTSTVLWLMNYKLRIQCFKVTPYQLNEQLFLDVEQVIPMKDAEDYIISMADKTQEDISMQEELKSRHLLRLEFWKQLLKEASNSKLNSVQNISPSKENWINLGTGLGGVAFAFVISKQSATINVYIGRPIKEENKHIFNLLQENKEYIEAKFGEPLTWEETPNIKSSRIKLEKTGVNYFNKEDWDEMIKFMVEGMIRLEEAFREPINKIKQSKSYNQE
ncbi:hypothetical protein FACS189421_01540 [Bacteroidia bacterium]|nr:hypothetical protein FACS189421_01540 [Bacteroidia bacterium]GHT50117.1 hypothetical protein FACS189440_17000 [Bacteroidia bacterium]GHT79198.1 hypothetical protein AGMMS50262_22620 [Bacteroidia bacterium]